MKKLIFPLLLLFFPVLAQAQSREIIPELNQVYQPIEHCDSTSFYITVDDHNTGTLTLIPKIFDLASNLIACDTFYVSTPIDHYQCVFTIAIPSGTYGSHSCVVETENTASETQISNVEMINLTECNVGIESNKPQWCNAYIVSGDVMVILNDNIPAIISVSDLHGKTLLQMRISETQLIPLDLSTGIYCLLIEQAGNRPKVFKLAVSD